MPEIDDHHKRGEQGERKAGERDPQGPPKPPRKEEGGFSRLAARKARSETCGQGAPALLRRRLSPFPPGAARRQFGLMPCEEPWLGFPLCRCHEGAGLLLVKWIHEGVRRKDQAPSVILSDSLGGSGGKRGTHRGG